MTTTTRTIYDNLIPMDTLLARLKRDRVEGVKIVSVLTKQTLKSYYTRVLATERETAEGKRYHTYRFDRQGKVKRSWVALTTHDLIVEGEVA